MSKEGRGAGGKKPRQMQGVEEGEGSSVLRQGQQKSKNIPKSIKKY
jgi:hypothetical protein